MPKSITLAMFQTLSNRHLLFKHAVPLAASMLALTLSACGGTSQSPEAVLATPAAATVVPATPSPDIAPTLQAKLDAFARQTITLRAANKQWQPRAEELGATAAIDGTDVRVSVDEAKLRAYLSKIAPQVAKPAVDAALAVAGSEISVTSSSEGSALDLDAAIVTVGKALAQNSAAQVMLPIKPVPPAIATTDAEAAKDQAAAFLAQPFELTVGKKTYSWDVETLAPLLTFKPHDGALALAADRAKLAAKVAVLADRSERPAKEPMVDWNGGNLRIRAPGQDGIRINEARAVDTIAQAFDQAASTVTLATEPLAPQVTSANLETLGIQEVVSVGKSDFSGSAAYRITNILAGMKLLNGTLIAPGAEFSFNNTVGEIDATNGFVEGHAIINNRTQIEFGGGICQDSTTVFRAAFWAGLPITDRKEHSYYISWYDKYGLGPKGNGPGLDAAIFTGVQDMRFVNDTGNWLLLQATAEPKAAVAQVTLYGTKPDREVSITHEIVKRTPAITKPEYFADAKQPQGSVKRTDTARGGMQIQVYRTVSSNGVQAKPELFATSFKPWPNKYAVNPADLGPEGIPVFLMQPTATVTPTVDPALPTADPNMPPAPTADPNAPQPTADPNAPPAPTADPNAFPVPTINPIFLPTPEPGAQPQPAPADPAQPVADPNALPPSG